MLHIDYFHKWNVHNYSCYSTILSLTCYWSYWFYYKFYMLHKFVRQTAQQRNCFVKLLIFFGEVILCILFLVSDLNVEGIFCFVYSSVLLICVHYFPFMSVRPHQLNVLFYGQSHPLTVDRRRENKNKKNPQFCFVGGN